MEQKKYLDLLAKRDIQPTAIRILVLCTMMQAGRSVSLLDLETMLEGAHIVQSVGYFDKDNADIVGHGEQ